ncbi:DTW domain-containing protein 2 [Trichoplax sp. H2]|nr:DTW domain-containing protein 2 [Trichoplax sp. H2]|eukprot:RDD39036.1 DTW domain-containing protein 2 [Trichoplax sp. H2]
MAEEDETYDEFLNGYVIEESSDKCREECARCNRPARTCLCSYLPAKPIETSVKIRILQHPREPSYFCTYTYTTISKKQQKRRLTTVPILTAALAKDSVHVYRGIRFTRNRLTELAEIASSPSTAILYPSSQAIDIKQLSCQELKVTNLFVIDGTWNEARTIMHRNEFLKRCIQVKLVDDEISKFVIRTQPNVTCVSTIEAVALSLEILENDHHIKEALLKPLRAMCDMQLACGAVVHHSKDVVKKMLMDPSSNACKETSSEYDGANRKV